jgi:hypothetical protein
LTPKDLANISGFSYPYPIMLRVIFNSFLGILITITGFYLIYLYLRSLRETSQPLLLLPAFPLIIFGIVLLIRTSRSDESLVISTYQNIPPKDNPDSQAAGNTGNIMEKNNQLLNNWIKESEKRDKMKILEIAAASQEEIEKNAKTNL